jgi:putative phage-type endonuclease
MTTYHNEIIQGTDEWLAIRCGKITASEVKKLLTAKNQPAENETSRKYALELAVQRVTGYTEPCFVSDDMLRGHVDEVYARELYSQQYAPVDQVGFATRDIASGVIIGASPDGLVGTKGLIEVKSRIQREQFATILSDTVPEEFMAQIQTQLLVTGREWCDFISYCGGMPMFVKRVWPDEKIQAAIVEACEMCESLIAEMLLKYNYGARNFHATARVIDRGDMIL